MMCDKFVLLFLAISVTCVFGGVDPDGYEPDECCGGPVVDANGQSVQCSTLTPCPSGTECIAQGVCCPQHPCSKFQCFPDQECMLTAVPQCPTCPPVPRCFNSV